MPKNTIFLPSPGKTQTLFFEVWKEKAVEVVVEMGAQQAPVTEIASRLVQMAYSSSRNPGEESPFAQAAAAHGASVPVGGCWEEEVGVHP